MAGLRQDLFTDAAFQQPSVTSWATDSRWGTHQCNGTRRPFIAEHFGASGSTLLEIAI